MRRWIDRGVMAGVAGASAVAVVSALDWQLSGVGAWVLAAVVVVCSVMGGCCIVHVMGEALGELAYHLTEDDE